MGLHPDKALPSARGGKRKQVDVIGPASASAASAHCEALESSSSLTKATKVKMGDGEHETRLRRFRAKAPQSFYDIYERATTQRFFVLSRTRCGTPGCPEEMIELTGSTGNIYNVCIAQQPSCDCPHGREGNQCKHWLYVMSRVLRARFNLTYQLALLSTELQEILARAPPPLDASSSYLGDGCDKNRKPIEGDCPICFKEFVDPRNTRAEAKASDAIVWCRAACGQNIHKQCFHTWSATKRQQAGGGGGNITCPFCRSTWEGDDDLVQNIKKTGPINEEGYVNVADQLGISTERDYSSYSRWWSGHPQSYRSYGGSSQYGRNGRNGRYGRS